MRITVEFSNLQELDEFCNSIAIAPGLLSKAKEESGQVVAKEPKAKKAKKEEPKVEETAETESAQEEQPAEEQKAEEPEKKYAIEDVRAILGKLQKAGKKEEVKELIASFGVDKLSQVKEEDYVSLIEKAGALDA